MYLIFEIYLLLHYYHYSLNPFLSESFATLLSLQKAISRHKGRLLLYSYNTNHTSMKNIINLENIINANSIMLLNDGDLLTLCCCFYESLLFKTN